jgi:pimeloyl-ACP methyl ester carboxylesterase
MSHSSNTSDAVILVHGLAANQLVMAPLARALGSFYGQVVNWGYSSLWSPIEGHAQRLAALIKGLEERAERVHVVAHSMGGIITRLALAEFQPRRLGRLVMVAPPNRGSHVATWLAPWLGRICPPLVQLADSQDSLVCRLPLPQVSELGVIAAATDFLVREPSTRLGCETDHITLPGLHSSLLWRRETAEQVQHFLEHGRFRRAA